MSPRLLVVVLAAVLCAACTAGQADPTPGSTAPLPTVASGPLICGMLPESSVKAMLGDRQYTVGGAGVVRKPDGSLLAATCWLQDPERRGTDNRFVYVFTIAGVDRMLLRDVYNRSREYTFPPELGPGIAQHQGDDGAVAALQWGDITLTVAINHAAPGRDPMRDAIALVQQVGTVLPISRTPSEPYPTREELFPPSPSGP
jgi:hypothetical protein